MMDFASGNLRRFRPDDATMAAYPLTKETAEAQLRVLWEKLTQLVAYLPRSG